ncbi:unnamed protein product [Periconia digitata]|uniref:Rhodopsin domain-containing protein n=1 Tax=Periconia digitata TaxID=1303443 RepID=A0A9W4XVK7_9PLEO|nr:unnamed protein product [Periconia digitata]
MPGGIHPPIEAVLSWPVPHYDEPVTRPMVSTMLACILGPISLFVVFARLWVRVYMQHNPDLDDWAMLAAVPFIIALTIMLPLGSDRYGFNRHIWDTRPHYFVIQRKLILAIETTFCIGAGLIKISILLFYRRLSSRAVSTPFKWTTWISIVFIAAYSLAFSLVPIFGCNPISAFWNQVNIVYQFDKNYTYTCFDEAADVVTASAISTAQDLLTAVLPTFIYWHLQIPVRQKIALSFLFAIAYGVVALGAMRLYATWRIFYDSYDVTWVGWELWIWTLLELHVGVICANAPALKAFFRQFFKVPKSLAPSSAPWRSTNDPMTTSGGRSSVASTVLFWKKACRAEKGYISDPYNHTTTVDQHGRVRIKKETRISQSFTVHGVIPDTASIDDATQLADTDFEMGILRGGTPPRSSQASTSTSLSLLSSSFPSVEDDLYALPPMSSSSPSSTMPRHHHQHTPSHIANWRAFAPRTPSPVARRAQNTLKLFPANNDQGLRGDAPDWRSWSGGSDLRHR